MTSLIPLPARRLACLLPAVMAVLLLSAAPWAQPVLDGTFDGNEVWGQPVASNLAPGWEGFNAIHLYVTSDETYVYVGAQTWDVGTWKNFGFIFNIDRGAGGSNDPWGRQILFAHPAGLPDFAIRGNYDGGWAEFRQWNGSNWDTGGGHNVLGDGHGGISTEFVEFRVPWALIGGATSFDIQFFISGNNDAEHGSFDSIPADERMTSWNHAGNPTVLQTYAGNRLETGARGWRMLSATRTGLTVEALANLSLVQGLADEYPQAAPNIYTGYDGSGNANGWLSPGHTGAALVPGEGFIWFHFDDAFDPNQPGGESVSAGLPLMIAAPGPHHVEDVTVSFPGRPAGDDFYLGGNPFINSFDTFRISSDVGTVQNTAWRWDPDAGPQGDYVELDRAAFATVRPWDGFFLQIVGVPAATAVNVTYDYDCVFSCPENFRPVERTRVALALIGMIGGTAVADQNASVMFVETATEGWDVWDAGKLYPFSTDWAVISPMGDKHGAHVAKAIESLPFPEGSVTVPVAFSASGGGEFTISLGDRTSVPDEWSIQLEDTVTGQMVDLRTGSITFSTDSASWLDERFRVHAAASPVSAGPGASPHEFSLAAAFPNPFSARTTVSFTLAEASDVSLAVFDVIGRRVALLAHGEHEAGPHSVSLDASALPSGVYVVRLSAGGNAETQRVTVTR